LETSGRAEAPGDVSHRRCARWRGRWWGRLQGPFARRLPPCGWDCVGIAAGIALGTSGRAEAPGDVSHRRCTRWRVRWRGVCSVLLPAGCRHAAETGDCAADLKLHGTCSENQACNRCQFPGNVACQSTRNRIRNPPKPDRPIDIDRTPHCVFVTQSSRGMSTGRQH